MYESFRWSKASERRNELTKIYEPIQLFILFSMANNFEKITFLDIGANIGVYSLFMAAHPNMNKVIAFEPQSDCLTELGENVRLNGLQNRIEIHPLALSNHCGSASFRRIGPYSGGSGVSETHLFKNLEYESEISVDVEKLDNIFDFKEKNLILKVDVEGHELPVLEGAQRLLSENFGILQIEIHKESRDYQKTISLLESLGWENVFRVGWDYYFSNLKTLKNDHGRIKEIEKSLSFFVENSLNGARPVRRNILPGIVAEMSRRRANQIKRIFSILRFRK
jgi:FkbM family methyltransferase